MASNMFSVEAAEKSLQADGYVTMEDRVVGDRVSDLELKGFPFASEYGLEFCRVNVLEDKRIRPILESLYERSSLGLYLRYGEDPGHIFLFRRGGKKAGFNVLIVQLWSPGSRGVFYRGSHMPELPTARAANAMYETPLTTLKRAGCEGKEVYFEHGGLAILDARVAFEIRKGFAIVFAFTTEDILETERWAKMVLPDSPELVRKVAQLESKTVGVNFAFKT